MCIYFTERYPIRSVLYPRFYCTQNWCGYNLEWGKLVFKVLPEDGKVKEMKGDGRRGRVPLLALPPKPDLLSQQTEMRLVRQQTQHYLEDGGGGMRNGV